MTREDFDQLDQQDAGIAETLVKKRSSPFFRSWCKVASEVQKMIDFWRLQRVLKVGVVGCNSGGQGSRDIGTVRG